LQEYAGIIHQRIDRPEALYGGFCDTRCGGRLPDVPIDQCQLVRLYEVVLLTDAP
jgi:hypothetical protein